MVTRHTDFADPNVRTWRRQWRRHHGAGLVLVAALAACGDDAADEPDDADETSAVASTAAQSSTSDSTRPTRVVQDDEAAVTATSGAETSDVAEALLTDILPDVLDTLAAV